MSDPRAVLAEARAFVADRLHTLRCSNPYHAHIKEHESLLSRIDATLAAIPDLVDIEGQDIVIRITPAALLFASENGCLCTFSQQKNGFRTVKITDILKWRDAVVRALRREKENGDTPVHLMLDDALEYAADQGEEGIIIEGVI